MQFLNGRVIIECMIHKVRSAAVFDLDGTLIDSMEIWREVDEEFFARRGMKVPELYQEQIAHLGFHECARFTIEKYLPKEREQDIIAEWRILSQEKYAAKDGAKYFKRGAIEFLNCLHAQGMKMAVATASSEELFLPILKAARVAEYFSCFVTVEQAGKNKGHPDIFELAANRLGEKTGNCFVFEDNLMAIKAAKRAGMHTVGVYDEATRSQRALIENEADFYILSFDELPSRLCDIFKLR